VVRSFAELRRARSPDERHALVVSASIPSAIVVQASEALGVPQGEVIDALGMRGATFYRWLQRGQPIAPEKNEALVRLAEFAELAAGAFGDEAKGKRWLAGPNAALGGATPLSLLASSYGAERVRRALSVIEYGGVA
jgi:putative toxin-antitoxin system antitoxin component (TIGR02293 family)